MLDNYPLIRSYFLGECILRVPLGSHDGIFYRCFSSVWGHHLDMSRIYSWWCWKIRRSTWHVQFLWMLGWTTGLTVLVMSNIKNESARVTLWNKSGRHITPQDFLSGPVSDVCSTELVVQPVKNKALGYLGPRTAKLWSSKAGQLGFGLTIFGPAVNAIMRNFTGPVP